MLEARTEYQVKTVESSARQIESESISTDVIENSKEIRLNEEPNQHQGICNDGLKKKTKRKKSTSIEGIGVESETSDVEYAIVQHENKRQKIEIGKQNDVIDVDKPSAKQPKDAKNNTETNKLRSKYENIHANTVQKLNAQAEQLRMEIGTLRTALANEQNAVRILRWVFWYCTEMKKNSVRKMN